MGLTTGPCGVHALHGKCAPAGLLPFTLRRWGPLVGQRSPSSSHQLRIQRCMRLGCRLETAEFREGDLYVVRHKPIQDLIKDRWVRLI